ncbi:virulence RhuM family protein [Candidatus Woesearchaeota archaeon]|nr:virulence RhuM family protein [Candidatus Woesearchaeota archaeon]
MARNTDNNKIVIYETEKGLPNIAVKIEDETVWLTQAQLADLFRTTRPNITMHIRNLFDEGELDENSVCKDFLHTANDGKKYKTKHYNLDLIISLGYRIKSKIATKFRQWATARLHEFIVKGFTMDDERLKKLGGGNYWKELLDRIKDIRSSEKVLYRQVLDLYATSTDYDPKSAESIDFFKVVQNKLHYASHGNTAPETIYNRADAEKEFMGLTSFKGDFPIKSDVVIAKNYLSKKELKVLNNIVSAFFDLAEVKAMNQEPMHMKDWIIQLDRLIQTFDKDVLTDAGKITHKKAVEKAEKEYKKYQVKTLSPVEKAYLESIKDVQKKVKKSVNKGANKNE